MSIKQYSFFDSDKPGFLTGESQLQTLQTSDQCVPRGVTQDLHIQLSNEQLNLNAKTTYRPNPLEQCWQPNKRAG